MSGIDLSGDIRLAIDEAQPNKRSLVLGYVDDDGHAALSFRGSTHVHSPDQLAFWSRKPAGPFIDSISQRPVVSFLYHSRDTPGVFFLSIRGRARVAAELNDEVYAAMPQAERDQDADRGGVAILVDVDSVIAFGDDGRIAQQRD